MPSVGIYGLFDPRTYLCRYVGQSTDPEQRFQGHLTLSGVDETNRKAVWIRELKREGLVPVLKILEWVDDADSYTAEVFWIHYLTWLGCPLTNTALLMNGDMTWRRQVVLESRSTDQGYSFKPARPSNSVSPIDMPQFRRLEERISILEKTIFNLNFLEDHHSMDAEMIKNAVCELCHHKDIALIEEKMQAGLDISLISTQYRVRRSMLVVHAHHRFGVEKRSEPIPPARNDQTPKHIPVEEAPLASAEVTEALDQRTAEHYFHTGWLAMDETRRQRNLQWLRDRLREDQMGLD